MREKPRNPVSVTKRNHLIPDGRLFGVGAATGGDRVSAEGKTGVRRQCAVCSRSGRIASGITLRRLSGGASEALVPERRRCPPATVGALSGGTVAGETRRKGAQHSPVRERNKIGVPAEKSLIFRWGIYSGSPLNHRRRFYGAKENPARLGGVCVTQRQFLPGFQLDSALRA